jgi:hypothetical protein
MRTLDKERWAVECANGCRWRQSRETESCGASKAVGIYARIGHLRGERTETGLFDIKTININLEEGG